MLVVVPLVGFLASDPGKVAADSRQYLYIDPRSFLARATSLWDPSFGAGTVPHQHLGFLWPMGPWFWAADAVGMPVWVAQRLWLAGIAIVAGLGMVQLCRHLGTSATAGFVAALAYEFTPYQLAFTARFSVLLLPWAVLPWLVLLTMRAIAERTWRAPVLFALVASTAGAVNASSLVLVLVAPAIVLAAQLGTARWRAAVGAGARIAAATLGACAWWLAGLVVQGRYGLPVLQLTENVDTVSAASVPQDIVRGLGNWIFASTDGTGTSIDQAAAYSDRLAVRLATIALPALAVAALVLVRRHGRGVVAAMLAIATVIGVGTAPLGDPSPYGELWRRFSEHSSLGLALRNAPRIGPVIVLATAVALAYGIDHLAGRARILGAVGVVCLVAVAAAPIARHGYLSADFERPEHIPGYWHELAADLDAAPDDSRVLELPGANFAAYTWGNTVEPVLPGLIDRPTLAREVLPNGGAGTTDLLGALDRRLQHDTLDPDSLAPVARLLGVGDVVIRGDIDGARFGLTDPRALVRRFLDHPPAGFTVTGRYGGTAETPVLLRLTLDQAPALLRADADPPVLLAGNGDGIIDAAAAGLIDGRRPVLESAVTDDDARTDALRRDARVIITDTNRKRASTFFYTITDDVGATETADRREPDPTGYDVRFGPFAEAPTDEQTVAVQLGGRVTATMGGGPEHPEDRAVNAFDGDPRTAWRPRAAPVGQQVEITFDRPVEAGTVTVHAATGGAHPTSIAVTVDGERFTADLDQRAWSPGGQMVDLPVDTVRSLAVRILAVDGPGIVGFSELDVGTATVEEALRVPTALVHETADASAGRSVSYVLTRARGDAGDPTRPPTERAIDRLVDVGRSATFRLSGSVSGAVAARGCDDAVVSIDGSPAPVRVEAGADGRSAVVGCGTVSLGSGSHHIQVHAEAGFALDQLVLSTGPDIGAPAGQDLGLTITADTDRHLAGTVAPTDQRFWLVLAESRNAGWQLTLDGGMVIDTSMVDGYANGWLIEPEGSGPVGVSLRWTPQRIVWAGMAISAITLVLAVAVLLRRRYRSVHVRWVTDATRGPVGGTPSPVALASGVGAVFAVGWFVADARVAVLAVLALIVRIVDPRVRVLLAAAACGAVVGALVTSRPSLVFVGLGCVLAELLGEHLQRSGETSIDASG